MPNVEERVITQDPTDRVLRGLSWANWLNGNDTLDSLTPAVWTIPAGLTLVSQSETTTDTYFIVTGGTVGEDYDITCQVKTVQGEIKQKSVRVKVRDF